MSPPLHQKHEKGTLDDNDRAQRKADLAKEIRHTKAGIWEVHEQIPHTRFGFDVPWVEKVVRNLEILEDLPFYWRMVKDVVKFKSCRYYLSLFLLVKTLVSLQPAVRLWYVILRVIWDPSDTQPTGSPVTLSPWLAFFVNSLASSNQSIRSKLR